MRLEWHPLWFTSKYNASLLKLTSSLNILAATAQGPKLKWTKAAYISDSSMCWNVLLSFNWNESKIKCDWCSLHFSLLWSVMQINFIAIGHEKTRTHGVQTNKLPMIVFSGIYTHFMEQWNTKWNAKYKKKRILKVHYVIILTL